MLGQDSNPGQPIATPRRLAHASKCATYHVKMQMQLLLILQLLHRLMFVTTILIFDTRPIHLMSCCKMPTYDATKTQLSEEPPRLQLFLACGGSKYINLRR